eukprot:9228104-Heterocapsa_arctica.AAC.1
MKEKQREATKRARAALMEGQSENKTKRRVLVSSAAEGTCAMGSVNILDIQLIVSTKVSPPHPPLHCQSKP